MRILTPLREGHEIESNNAQGAAYVFRNLDTVIGIVTEDVKLTSSDGVGYAQFGHSVSQSGSIGLVGAFRNDIGVNSDQGSAYVFRNLDTATGTVTQNAMLVASDGAESDRLGISVSLSGSIGLVGAYEDEIGGNSRQGSAYVFRNLDTATGTVTQSVKLVASDGAAGDHFGNSVSQSGSSGLVGAHWEDIGTHGSQGAAYVFRNLDAATGTVTETVKLSASGGVGNTFFGSSVNLNGDNFLIGARSLFVGGKAYSGSLSSVTTLDTGATSLTISEISFTSQEDWIIGATTDGNAVTLSATDTAVVTVGNNAVYIGQSAGSDNNNLTIAGTLVAKSVRIGSRTGTVGNTLTLRSTADISGTSRIVIREAGKLMIEGDYTAAGALLTYLGETILRAWDGSTVQTVTNSNQNSLLTAVFSGGFTTFTTVVSSIGGYSNWALTNAPTGLASDDFDGDGVANALEFVFGGSKDSNDLGKLPQASAFGDNLVFIFQRSQSSADVTTEIQTGTSLDDWPDTYTVLANNEVQEPGVTVVDNPGNPGFDTVTLTVAKDPDSTKFARVRATP